MEHGEKTADLCRAAGVSQGTMYQWKSKYSGMEVSQLKKLKEMESELSQYKKIVAVLQWINFSNGKPINHIKLALAG